MRQAIGGVARPTLQSGRFEMTSARIVNDRVRDAKFFAARGVDRISEQVQFGWRNTDLPSGPELAFATQAK